MRVLVVGGGGREHALVWKIHQSPLVKEIFCAPGNAGIQELAQCVDINPGEIHRLADFAQDRGIDLTVVGPEEPLVLGITDEFERRALPIFGVGSKAAMLEGSKAFAKEFMKRNNIPTADFMVFSDVTEARDFIESRGAPIVVKADGLAAGKGVFPCTTKEEALAAVERIMVERAFGDAGRKVVVEEFLEGEEASFLALADGHSVLPFPSSQDHKAVYDGDRGPNTGGMGAYSPAPVVSEELHRHIMERIMIPVVRAMASEGSPFKGMLYAGLMISGQEARVLEFNVRFGDPEAQPLLMRLDSDLVPLLEAAISGRLNEVEPRWDPRPAVCVVMASGGYPGPYTKGHPISGLEEVQGMEDVVVFHAGTARRNSTIVTDGGRVLGVTARGETLREAIKRAYEAVERIHWEGAHFRRDIGHRALEKEGFG
jgi:phosphoribosylamine--glycine ligase